MDFPFDHTWIELLAEFFVGAAGLGCLYLLVGAIALLWRAREGKPAAATAVPVTILKPLHGDEPGLFDRLMTFCTQLYDAPVQIVFGVQDADDPAVAVVRRLQAALPGAAIDLKIDARSHGANRKISNVVNMVTLARHPVIVLADSDIEVGRDYLRAVVGELQRPNVGLVTCLYHGLAGEKIAPQLARLALDTHFLPNATTAIRLGLTSPCFGSTIALRLETLDRIGGFQAFADCLADDNAIGDAVTASGETIAITPFTVGHACRQQTLRAVLSDDLRSARTIRSIDPLGHFGALVVTHPLPFALVAAALGAADGPLMIPIAIICRLALCLCVERAFGIARHPYWLIPLRDLLSFGVHVTSFFGNAVAWRGHRYRVLDDGRLVEDGPTVQS
jgi:ceramide glucosyltransferase